MAEFFSNLKDDFYQSFLEGGRWLLYLKGVGVTLEVAAMALVMGIILGVLVAIQGIHKLTERSPKKAAQA